VRGIQRGQNIVALRTDVDNLVEVEVGVRLAARKGKRPLELEQPGLRQLRFSTSIGSDQRYGGSAQRDWKPADAEVGEALGDPYSDPIEAPEEGHGCARLDEHAKRLSLLVRELRYSAGKLGDEHCPQEPRKVRAS
jgi:hypothetical protein